MWLCGRPGEAPLRASHALPSCANGALLALRQLRDYCDGEPNMGADLLTERSGLLGMSRRGSVSAGGACEMFQVADGYLAVSLPRDDDWALLPAWLAINEPVASRPHLASLLLSRSGADLESRGRGLGLAVALVAAVTPPASWYRLRDARQVSCRRRRPLVVDLSALWAGPLCSHLLQLGGARVIRVESRHRPDPGRQQSAAFFNLLNAGKENCLLDLQCLFGRQQLEALLCSADIVIEGSRPRALAQMGIDAQRCINQRQGLLWLSISGHGLSEPQCEWVAFGDDASVAGGLSVSTAHGPVFCGDAVADPLTGLHAALAVTALWQNGWGGRLDINLRTVAAFSSGFYRSPSVGLTRLEEGRWRLECAGIQAPVCAPRVRMPAAKARSLGADTDALSAEFAAVC